MPQQIQDATTQILLKITPSGEMLITGSLVVV